MPAVFVTGSTVNRIKVSVQSGQSSWAGSPPRNPTKRMLMRLPPSQVGYWTSGTGGSGVGGRFASGVPCAFTTGVPSGLTAVPEQLASGIPGSDVNRQQAVKLRAKTKSPMEAAKATLQKMIRPTENFRILDLNLGSLMFLRKSSILFIVSIGA